MATSIERAWAEHRDPGPKAGRKNKGIARMAKALRREEAIERQRWLLNTGAMVSCRHGKPDPDTGVRMKAPAGVMIFGAYPDGS